MCVTSRAGDVKAVVGCHLLELLQSLDLLRVLLAVACPVLGEGLICVAILILLLLLNQVVNTVQCNTTVVANDAATAVCVRKTGDDVGGTRCADTRSVDIEDCVVVSLAVLGEDLLDLGVDFLAGFLNSGLDHTPAAVWHHCTL